MQKRITLLGGLTVTKDGQPIPKLISRKADALLAYLAHEQRAHSREALATLLWDERSQKQALSNLRTLLSNLRKHAADFVTITRKTAVINDDVWVDTAVFQQHLADNQLEDALALYQGDFLDGVLLRGCLELENWIQHQCEQQRQQVIGVYSQHITKCLQQGEYHDGIHHATRLLEMDPWNEETHRQMMQLLARSGQRQAALAQYETCVQLLDDELGLPPEPETTALFERIQSAAETPAVNLPTLTTAFIGREQELTQCVQQLRDPDCRLLTLIGLGGIGKTRLALQAAAALQSDFLNGVYFVPLAAIESPDGMITAVAETINAPFTANSISGLHNYLRGKEMLLVLDNFEQLLPAATQIADLLRHAPAVKVLVTSRVRLDLRAEWLLELSGLAYAGKDSPAVQLFAQRARTIAPDFELTPNLPHVTRICEIVHGMPLGIELASAWIRVLTPGQIVQQIEQNLDLLATTAQDVPQRQRSLTAVFDSVWSLLNQTEQQTFAQLSVFRGNFDLAAFLEITGASPWTLAALVEKSLLQKEEGGTYRLVELLRLYSAARLSQSGLDEAATHQRHSQHYLTFLQAQHKRLKGREQDTALQAISWERENIRAAWLWAAHQTDTQAIHDSSPGLTSFYRRYGPFAEGIDLLQAALSKLQQQSTAEANHSRLVAVTVAQLLVSQGHLLHESSRHDEALAVLNKAEPLLETIADPPIHTRYLIEKGRVYWRKSEHETAVFWIQSALTHSRDHQLAGLEAQALAFLGAIAIQQADYTTAVSYYQQALPIAQQSGDREQEARIVNNLGVYYTETGDFLQAQQCHERSLQIKQEIGDVRGQAMSLSNLGVIAMGRGRYIKSKEYLEKSRRLRVQLGDRRGEGRMYMNLGRVAAHLGQYDKATRLLQQSLAIAQEVNSPLAESEAVIVLGIIAAQVGDYQKAHLLCCQALNYAEKFQHWSLVGHAQQWRSQALLGLGRIQEAVGLFQTALTLRQELGEVNLIVESQAGLAGALLASGDLVGAQLHVDQVLAHLQTGDLAGTDDPFRIRLVCCQVLTAVSDPRAPQFITTAIQLLQEWAGWIGETAVRESYLNNVAAHRELLNLRPNDSTSTSSRT